MYVQVFRIMHRVKTRRATRRRQNKISAGGATDGSSSSRAARSSSRLLCLPAGGRGIPIARRPGPLPRASVRARLTRRPRHGLAPPPARIQALLAPARPPAVAPRASPGPPPVRSRDARVRLPGGCPRPSARAPPATMFCAISGVTPTDPVISARTGHVFERSLITKAIQVRPPPASDARRPRGARAPRAPARGFRSFSRLPRSPFPAIAPRSPPRPLSDRPSTPHHPLNPSRASSIVVPPTRTKRTNRRRASAP